MFKDPILLIVTGIFIERTSGFHIEEDKRYLLTHGRKPVKEYLEFRHNGIP